MENLVKLAAAVSLNSLKRSALFGVDYAIGRGRLVRCVNANSVGRFSLGILVAFTLLSS